MARFLVLITLFSAAAAVTTQDLTAATQEMQKANYFTFVLLIKMAPFFTFQENITFLMPNDRTLSETSMAETSVEDFLLRHSIPSPLLIDHLHHFPTGSLVPTSEPGLMLKVTNDGRKGFFLSNVRIVSPNICTKGSSIRCHGVDGVLQPVRISEPDDPPTSSPPAAVSPPQPAVPPPLEGDAAQAPAAEPPSTSSGSSGAQLVLDLVITFCILAVASIVCV